MFRNTQHFIICISHAFFTAGATQTVPRDGLHDVYFLFFFTKKSIHSYSFCLSGSVNKFRNFVLPTSLVGF